MFMYNTRPCKSWFKKCYVNFNIVLLSIHSLHFTINLVPANIRIRITEIIIIIIQRKKSTICSLQEIKPSERSGMLNNRINCPKWLFASPCSWLVSANNCGCNLHSSQWTVRIRQRTWKTQNPIRKSKT